MRKETYISIVLPVYNEGNRIEAVIDSIYRQTSKYGIFTLDNMELIIVDNNSTDDSIQKVKAAQDKYKDLTIHIINETTQGVSSARKKGMDYASQRAGIRNIEYGIDHKHYIVSADADCEVDKYWIDELVYTMLEQHGDLGTCNYYYDKRDFELRPNLYREIDKTLRCRHFSFSLFGGFPDGKGFAVEKRMYDAVGGIEIFYQLEGGRFVEHLSDDWDFGIKVIACGGKPVYAPEAYVKINSRRVDTLLYEVMNGTAYGKDGIIIMKDVRPTDHALENYQDLSPEQAEVSWFNSIKDYIPKNIVLPVLLNPSLLVDNPEVIEFFTPEVAESLYRRIYQIKYETSVVDFKPIHAYKTPAFRLYFEFRHEIFNSLRRFVGEDIGSAPPLPACFDTVDEKDFLRFVYYFCEDRESGEAHNYFANGGVF
ncbi:glycosyltransferase [Lonsdalea quercina]|uniref:Glycosyl transferase family 2 n=1 Tax=Lonsdalea quercina TaxID=71657 RepID=A0A1H4EF72_9GAMM|nr:glycosyltransferase family 2 protein [Lonsdalea quercina]SEA83683.1 Glycosyl transferase family 2 [Lonsdalea quercina]